jgi:hypothetical protein
MEGDPVRSSGFMDLFNLPVDFATQHSIIKIGLNKSGEVQSK